MLPDTLRRMFVAVLLCLTQALVLNRIQLFHVATPLLYVYFAIIFPRGYARWAVLLWCFCLGLCVDMFSNTPGLASASMTLAALLQPYLLELFLPRNAEESVKSSAAALGYGNFAALASILVVVYSLTFFTLEAFSFSDWLYWLECVGSSAVLTLVLILTLESIRR